MEIYFDDEFLDVGEALRVLDAWETHEVQGVTLAGGYAGVGSTTLHGKFGEFTPAMIEYFDVRPSQDPPAPARP